MIKAILYISIVVFSISLEAQTSLPYSTGFDNSSEQAGWTEYRKGATTDTFYLWNFSGLSPNSLPNCLAHDYPVGGTQITDDWFVSPPFSFPKGGTIDSIWHSFSGFGTPMAGDTIALYLLTGDQDPSLASSKTLLYLYSDSTYLNDNTWRLKSNILIPPVSGQSFIAFKYTTTSNWLDVKFDDIKINGDTSTGINSLIINEKELIIFPNPASNYIIIDRTSDFSISEIKLIDIFGKEVKTFESSDKKLNVSELLPGQYFLRIKTENGILVKKIMKE